MWYRSALPSIDGALLATDGNGRVPFINPAARLLTGWNVVSQGKEITEIMRILDEDTHNTIENILHGWRRHRRSPKSRGRNDLLV